MEQDLNIEGIKRIKFDDTKLSVVQVDDETLWISTPLNGHVIDANFTELDDRLSQVESQIRLKLNGEIIRLNSEIEDLKTQLLKL